MGFYNCRSIASLGSILSPEVISNIERAYLSPYYQQLSKNEKVNSNLPLLDDFDAEIAVYVVNWNKTFTFIIGWRSILFLIKKNARDQIKQLQNFQNVNWIRVELEPTIDVLITLTNKLIWKFTSFLSSQVDDE